MSCIKKLPKVVLVVVVLALLAFPKILRADERYDLKLLSLPRCISSGAISSSPSLLMDEPAARFLNILDTFSEWQVPLNWGCVSVPPATHVANVRVSPYFAWRTVGVQVRFLF